MKKYEKIIDRIKAELPENNLYIDYNTSNTTSSKYIGIYKSGEPELYPDFTIRISSHGIPYTENRYGKKITKIPVFDEISYENEIEDLDINMPSMVFKIDDLDYKLIAKEIMEAI